jgi:hypothetical protein
MTESTEEIGMENRRSRARTRGPRVEHRRIHSLRIVVTDPERDEIEAIAKAEDRTACGVVRRALSLYLQSRSK